MKEHQSDIELGYSSGSVGYDYEQHIVGLVTFI